MEVDGGNEVRDGGDAEAEVAGVEKYKRLSSKIHDFC